MATIKGAICALAFFAFIQVSSAYIYGGCGCDCCCDPTIVKVIETCVPCGCDPVPCCCDPVPCCSCCDPCCSYGGYNGYQGGRSSGYGSGRRVYGY